LHSTSISWKKASDFRLHDDGASRCRSVIGFHLKNPLEGYRRLTFMMLDAGIVAVSPTSVWRVLGQAGLLSKWKSTPSKKGPRFEQPLAAHQHWHIDIHQHQRDVLLPRQRSIERTASSPRVDSRASSLS
jgi:hypothetical protein